MLTNLGWPMHLSLSIFFFGIAVMLLWWLYEPKRPSNRLHALWREISGLRSDMEIAVQFNSSFRHCEIGMLHLIPKLDRLKIKSPSPEIEPPGISTWIDFLLKLQVAAENKQIVEARRLVKAKGLLLHETDA